MYERSGRDPAAELKQADEERKLQRLQRNLRFVSTDRRYFWRMPTWLWVPIVMALVVLLVAALLVA
ncbi:hypothetical protein LJR129_004951 [Acidovorax sp. LjRoot129]|uniref:hypothetical protein n=1 Tax=unclassified Acidovorax TaxID=2684926 RepID=UPI003ED0E78F